MTKTEKIDWEKIRENYIPQLLKRAVYKTKKYIIVPENLAKPLNYEIYPIKKGKVVVSEGQRLYTSYRNGLDFAKEVAKDNFGV